MREIAKRMGCPGHQAFVQRIIDEKRPANITATLSYEGDLAIAQRIEEIRGRIG